MNHKDSRPRIGQRGGDGRRAPGLLAGVLASAFLLGACSQVPDWADPTDWFESQAGPTAVAQTEEQRNYAQTAAFPNLGSVPDVPPRFTAPELRSKIMENLAADRGNAVYSGEKLTGQPLAAAPSPAAISTAIAAPSTLSQKLVPAGGPSAPKIAGELSADGGQMAVPAARIAQAAPAQTLPTQTFQAVAPQFQPQQAQAPVVAGPQGRTELVAIIYFAHGSAGLDAQDRQILSDVAALHRARGGKIRVIGHASAHTAPTGQVEHRLANFEISLKRSNSVTARLISLGVGRDEIRAEAKGDGLPVYHEFMNTGEAGNRRVEIFLEY